MPTELKESAPELAEIAAERPANSAASEASPAEANVPAAKPKREPQNPIYKALKTVLERDQAATAAPAETTSKIEEQASPAEKTESSAAKDDVSDDTQIKNLKELPNGSKKLAKQIKGVFSEDVQYEVEGNDKLKVKFPDGTGLNLTLLESGDTAEAFCDGIPVEVTDNSISGLSEVNDAFDKFGKGKGEAKKAESKPAEQSKAPENPKSDTKPKSASEAPKSETKPKSEKKSKSASETSKSETKQKPASETPKSETKPKPASETSKSESKPAEGEKGSSKKDGEGSSRGRVLKQKLVTEYKSKKEKDNFGSADKASIPHAKKSILSKLDDIGTNLDTSGQETLAKAASAKVPAPSKAPEKTETKTETKTDANASGGLLPGLLDKPKTETTAETKTETPAETKTEASAEKKTETPTETKTEDKALNSLLPGIVDKAKTETSSEKKSETPAEKKSETPAETKKKPEMTTNAAGGVIDIATKGAKDLFGYDAGDIGKSVKKNADDVALKLIDPDKEGAEQRDVDFAGALGAAGTVLGSGLQTGVNFHRARKSKNRRTRQLSKRKGFSSMLKGAKGITAGLSYGSNLGMFGSNGREDGTVGQKIGGSLDMASGVLGFASDFLDYRTDKKAKALHKEAAKKASDYRESVKDSATSSLSESREKLKALKSKKISEMSDDEKEELKKERQKRHTAKAQLYAMKQAERMHKQRSEETNKSIQSLIGSGIGAAGSILGGLSKVLGSGNGVLSTIGKFATGIAGALDTSKKDSKKNQEKRDSAAKDVVNEYLDTKVGKIKSQAKDMQLSDKEKSDLGEGGKEITDVEAQKIAIMRLGVDVNFKDGDSQEPLSDDEYKSALNKISEKRANNILKSSGDEKKKMLDVLGLDADASFEEVVAALNGE